MKLKLVSISVATLVLSACNMALTLNSVNYLLHHTMQMKPMREILMTYIGKRSLVMRNYNS